MVKQEMENKLKAVIVNRHEKSFKATINGKEIKMTFEELELIEKLLGAVINDYEGTAYAAYVDGNDIVTLYADKEK